MNAHRTRRWNRRSLACCLALATVSIGASPATGAEVPLCDGKVATVVGTDGDDQLRGTAAADVIVGLDGDDVIRGLAGGDALCGGSGADEILGHAGPGNRLFGDAGADRLVGGDARDVFKPGAGADVVVGGGGFDVVSYYPTVGSSDEGVVVDLQDGVSRSERGRDRLSGIAAAEGTRFDDELFGDGDRNLLRGFEGDDRLSGRGGNDRDPNKRITGLDGGLGRDTILGGRGSDVLADDHAEGDGRARMFGGDGNDVLSLLRPRQWSSVDGGDGTDTFMVVGDEETPVGPIVLTLASHVYIAESEDRNADFQKRTPVSDMENAITGPDEDVINGTSGDNVLYGGGGSDSIWGGDGDDVIWGGDGGDFVNGRRGHDVCYLDPADDSTHCEEWPSGAPTNHPI